MALQNDGSLTNIETSADIVTCTDIKEENSTIGFEY